MREIGKIVSNSLSQNSWVVMLLQISAQKYLVQTKQILLYWKKSFWSLDAWNQFEQNWERSSAPFHAFVLKITWRCYGPGDIWPMQRALFSIVHLWSACNDCTRTAKSSMVFMNVYDQYKECLSSLNTKFGVVCSRQFYLTVILQGCVFFVYSNRLFYQVLGLYLFKAGIIYVAAAPRSL